MKKPEAKNLVSLSLYVFFLVTARASNGQLSCGWPRAYDVLPYVKFKEPGAARILSLDTF
jgi:hypothetical protein